MPGRPFSKLFLSSFAGRAWLYLALNENSLESYLRLFQENLGLLQKYYVRSVYEASPGLQFSVTCRHHSI
jgi:hypothetical protein